MSDQTRVIFHVATAADWALALASGEYTTSTIGVTLEQEGFIHAARGDQWEDVRRRYYAEVSQPLVLLVVDVARLESPWREDSVGDATYPHVYGPINTDAVLAAVPLAPFG